MQDKINLMNILGYLRKNKSRENDKTENKFQIASKCW